MARNSQEAAAGSQHAVLLAVTIIAGLTVLVALILYGVYKIKPQSLRLAFDDHISWPTAVGLLLRLCRWLERRGADRW